MAPFFLLNLPLVPLNQVIKSMHIAEVGKLPMCSTRTGDILKRMKYDLEAIGIYLSSGYSHFTLVQSETECACFAYTTSKYYRNNGILITNRSENLENMQTNTLNDPIDDCLNMAKYICSVIKTKRLHHIFRVDTLQQSRNMKELISNCLLDGDNYQLISLEGGDLSLDFLNHVMTTAKLEATLSFNYNSFPLDFRHENAFKFHSMRYNDARWVKMDDLKSIRNSDEVNLGQTIFDCNDLNQFFHYWVNCKHDMMQLLSLKYIPFYRPTDVSDILKQLCVVRKRSSKTYYIMARGDAYRKWTVGVININEPRRSIEMKCEVPEGSFGNIPQTFANIYRRANLIKEKENLGIRNEFIEAEIETINEKLKHLGFESL